MSIISRIKTWVTGDTLTASDLNAEFNNIVNDYNGNITDANISGSAAITNTKISGTAVTLAGSQTLTNKTLTSPIINVGSDAQGDLYYRNGAGVFTRLAPGTSGQFLQTQGAAANPVWANSTTGKVAQIVSSTYAVATSDSTGSLVDSGLTATITPTSASNKIIVMAHMNGVYIGTSGNVGLRLALLRGGSIILDGGTPSIFGSNAVASAEIYLGLVPLVISDSPATTASTTYKVQFSSYGATTATVQKNSVTSTIILMEVAP